MYEVCSFSYKWVAVLVSNSFLVEAKAAREKIEATNHSCPEGAEKKEKIIEYNKLKYFT